MGPPKRPSEELQHAGKIPKTEHGLGNNSLNEQHEQHGDFSGSVKKRLANSSRTGQACDRCKVRKIRCDGRPEGCSPCAQNRTPCKTTDRITGRPTLRGQVEAMEGENAFLRAHVAELQAQLKEVGVEPRGPSNYTGYLSSNMPWTNSSHGNDGQGWGDASQRRASTSPIPGYAPANGLESTEYRPLPQFKPGSIGDNYLGVSSTDSLLSHIKGTSLSLFGTGIDITDFVDNEEDYDKSVMSYQHFLSVAMGEDRNVQHLPFPPYQTLTEYSTWYLRSLNPYTMLLDKPTFMHLIWRIGNEPNFTPTTAETVCVHMMLGTLKYQISVRNGQVALMEESHKHYRYCLSFYKDLLSGHKWQDLQALTLVCLHLRNFPKPGAAWIMCSTTFLLAIELGLHRSVKAWADAAGHMDDLEVEMRKRIFWTLHALAVNLSGKLGRPMPINLGDIDVEFPEPVNDCLAGEDASLTPFRKCSFHVGIQIAKYTIWSSELFNTVYAVRQSPRSYEDSVRRLEGGIQRWKEQLPIELADPSRASQDGYIFSLYLEFWEQEFQLLLHHPAVCRSTDPEFINANMDKCLATSKKMLHNCNQLRKFRSLDIPWINSVVYIAAIFTTLFINFQRKDQMTSVDMTKLKEDMDQWYDVMGECGQLLDSGDKLKHAVRKIVEHSLNSINDSIVKRTATESLARAALQNPQESSATSVYGNSNGNGNGNGNGSFHGQYSAASASTDPSLNTTGSSSYAAGASFPYSNATTGPVTGHPQLGHAYDQQAYSSGEDAGMTPSHAAALAAAASGATPQRADNYPYANGADGKNGQQSPYMGNGVGPADWRQWTRTYMQQVGPTGEFLNTANTLMALGGREGGAQVPGQESAGAMDASAMQAPGPSNLQWPGIIFGVGPNGHVDQQ